MTASPPIGDAAAALPPGRQFAVAWGIPDDFGGMTAALLQRSRAFVRHAGVEVDVVTFEPRPDIATVRESLHARGELIDGIRLRNIYEHFRAVERAPVAVRTTPGRASRACDAEVSTPHGSLLRWREGDDDVRVEHRRADGSLAVVEERRRGGRLVTSFDGAGRTTGQWRSMSAFRFAWLDELTARGPAVVIVDSKTTARFLQKYRRPGVTMIHLVHGSHHDAAGRLTASRRATFENLHRWDAVVFLTERQRAAAAELVGDTRNLAVVPNAIALPEHIPRLPPDRLHGVIVSRLSPLKRLDHALRIIAAVRDLDIPVTAEIVGDGSRRARLEAQASALGLDGAVRFVGYVPHGAERYLGAAWTLLTSRSEGESLSILEAMAAGCLPVAYDIRYGPAEVIADGRNGRLVADGDIDAAVRALVGLCLVDDAQLAAMRRHARRTAQSHDDLATVARWAEVQQAAVERRARREDIANAPLGRLRVRRLRGRLLVTARMAPSHSATKADVRLTTRSSTSALLALRRFGRWRFVRLTREASARLGEGAVKTRFLLHVDGVVVGVDAGTHHPDPRSVVRRVIDRLRRG